MSNESYCQDYLLGPGLLSHHTLASSAISMQPTPVLFLGSYLQSTSPSLPQWWVPQAWECWAALTVQVSLCFGLSEPVTMLSSEAPKLPLCPCWSACQWMDFSSCRKIFPFTVPSQGHRSQVPFWFLSPLLLFFFLNFFLLPCPAIFLLFWKSEVFCPCSIDVLWELFHLQMYFLCIYRRKWAP